MKSKEYYIVIHGKPNGPFSFENLKNQKINRESLIWFDGLDKWERARNIPELQPLFRAVPPPIDPLDIKEEANKMPPIPEPPAIPKQNLEIASNTERFVAFIITQIFALVLFFLLGGSLDEEETWQGLSLEMLYAALGGGIFNGIFYPFFSGNLGHYMMGIKVVSYPSKKEDKSIFSGFLREFLKGGMFYLILPCIWLFFNDQKQNVYDLFVDTIVVRKK